LQASDCRSASGKNGEILLKNGIFCSGGGSATDVILAASDFGIFQPTDVVGAIDFSQPAPTTLSTRDAERAVLVPLRWGGVNAASRMRGSCATTVCDRSHGWRASVTASK
jgi:hypothetical protein